VDELVTEAANPSLNATTAQQQYSSVMLQPVLNASLTLRINVTCGNSTLLLATAAAVVVVM